MRTMRFALGLIIGCLLTMQTLAVEVKNLNSIALPVENQTQQSLQKVLPQAFGEVLIKFTGNPGVMTLPKIQNVLPNVGKYLQSYSFYQAQNSSGELQSYVKITFDQKAILDLLDEAGQAIWNQNRPLTLVWVGIVNKQGMMTMMSSTSDQQMSHKMMSEAKKCGLPIILPLMDLQDQSHIDNDSSNQFDLSKIQQVANRYQVQSVLAGKLQQTQSNWTASWLFSYNGQPFQWVSSGVNVNELISQAILKTATLLANQLSTLDEIGLQNKISVAISGIDDLTEYVTLVNKIKKLPEVARVEVSEMGHSTLILNVTISSSVHKFAEDLKRNQDLQVLNTFNNGQMGAQPATLSYQWANNKLR